MEQRTRDYQQMTIAILAIATAALGFALWAQDFDAALPKTDNWWIFSLHVVQMVSIIGALIFYFFTFTSVRAIIGHGRHAANRNLIGRPIDWLYWQMVALTVLFIVGFLSEILVANMALPMECLTNDPGASPQ